jgi:hypothetical protein
MESPHSIALQVFSNFNKQRPRPLVCLSLALTNSFPSRIDSTPPKAMDLYSLAFFSETMNTPHLIFALRVNLVWFVSLWANRF